MRQVVTVAKFQGGGAFNVIPDSVTIGGTFRAFSMESLLQLKKRIDEVKLVWPSVFLVYDKLAGSVYPCISKPG